MQYLKDRLILCTLILILLFGYPLHFASANNYRISKITTPTNIPIDMHLHCSNFHTTTILESAQRAQTWLAVATEASATS